jgi:hypothetical protein
LLRREVVNLLRRQVVSLNRREVVSLTVFSSKGLKYTLLERNEKVALYSVGGTYSDRVTHFEVCKIYIRKDKYSERESLPANEQFGRDLSRCFNDYESALIYFDALTKLYQGVLKVVSGVEEDIKAAA